MIAMEPKDAIQMMMIESGESNRGLSKAIGKCPSYVSSMINRGANVSTKLLVTVAEAMGFQVVLHGHGKEIPLKKGKGAKHGRKAKHHRMDNEAD